MESDTQQVKTILNTYFTCSIMWRADRHGPDGRVLNINLNPFRVPFVSVTVINQQRRLGLHIRNAPDRRKSRCEAK